MIERSLLGNDGTFGTKVICEIIKQGPGLRANCQQKTIEWFMSFPQAFVLAFDPLDEEPIHKLVQCRVVSKEGSEPDLAQLDELRMANRAYRCRAWFIAQYGHLSENLTALYMPYFGNGVAFTHKYS